MARFGLGARTLSANRVMVRAEMLSSRQLWAQAGIGGRLPRTCMPASRSRATAPFGCWDLTAENVTLRQNKSNLARVGWPFRSAIIPCWLLNPMAQFGSEAETLIPSLRYGFRV